MYNKIKQTRLFVLLTRPGLLSLNRVALKLVWATANKRMLIAYYWSGCVKTSSDRAIHIAKCCFQSGSLRV